MKRISILTCLLAVIMMGATGCIKEQCSNRYKIYIPQFKSISELRREMKFVAPQALKQTGKIFLSGQYVFVNEVNKGIHIIDNSNPSTPQNIGFLNIPGNMDMAVRNGYLYADSYSDLVVFNIGSFQNATPQRFLNNVFPDRNGFAVYLNNPDSMMVVTGFQEKDTVVDCATYRGWSSCPACITRDASGIQTFSVAPSLAIGGSMARFTAVNDHLYAVTSSSLISFSLMDPADPQQTSTTSVGQNIETIFPFNNRLFIGSAQGMFLYGLNNPSQPSYISQFGHVRSCDPVIADAQNAYVTLRSGTFCGGGINELQVLNISNVSNPSMVRTYPLSNPHGLGKDGNLLVICDGAKGLKFYNAADPANLILLKEIGGLVSYDVILNAGLALVVAQDGLYQYDYANLNSIRLLSKVSIQK